MATMDQRGRAISFSRAQMAFMEKVKETSKANTIDYESGNFEQAIERYTEAISLDRTNHQLFCRRSAAFAQLGKYSEALADAERAVELQPAWAKGHLRQGAALQAMQRYEEAMVAYVKGLTCEPTNQQLLNLLKEVALISIIKDTFQPVLARFENMGLDTNPFIMTSIIGQEVLSSGSVQIALPILQAAESLGTDNAKLQASLHAALGTAHWRTGNQETALVYMQRAMDMALDRGDRPAQCRMHGSLGEAYMSMGNHALALSHLEQQHAVAMELEDEHAAINALSSIGLLRASEDNINAALTCHKKAHAMAKRFEDGAVMQAQQLGHMGHCYHLLGDYDRAITCHNKHLTLAQRLKLPLEQCKATEKLSQAYLAKLNFAEAMNMFKHLLALGVESKDQSVQAKAYGGLARACKSTGDTERALACHQEQLKLLTILGDQSSQAAVLTSMGTLCYQLSRYHEALHYHGEHLQIVKDLEDRAAEGCAYGNLGIVHKALGHNIDAIKFHLLELTIAQEVGDRASEASTHGNLGIVYQAEGDQAKAEYHFELHLSMADDLNDLLGQARALNNLGHHFLTSGAPDRAIPHLERCLQLSVRMKDRMCEFRACNHLGQAYLAVQNHQKAIQYFERVFSISKGLQDRAGMGRACSRLGDVYKAMGDLEQAQTYHKQLFALSQQLQHAVGQCTALANLGELSLAQGDLELASEYYHQLMTVAEREKQGSFEAIVHSGLAAVCRARKQFREALSHYECTLSICQENLDKRGMSKALGHMADTWLAIGDFAKATEHYGQQLALAAELQDILLECLVYRSLGLAYSKVGEYDTAISYHKQQVSVAGQLPPNQQLEVGRAWANLGESYECLFEHNEAIRCYEKLLETAVACKNNSEQLRAHAGLGRCYRELGQASKATNEFEKRLQLAQILQDVVAEVECYADIGQVQRSLGDFEQAVDYHYRQLVTAKTMGDLERQSQAMCDLGEVYQEMGRHEDAVTYHRRDLELSEQLQNIEGQARAAANLGTAFFALRQFDNACTYHQRQLTAAIQLGDLEQQASAYNALGMCRLDMGQQREAVESLQRGLQVVERVQVHSLQAELRMNLGLALHMGGRLEEARAELETAIALFDRTTTTSSQGFVGSHLRLVIHYQQLCLETLQQIFVAVGDVHTALVMAERCRARYIQSLLLERQVQMSLLHRLGLMKGHDVTKDDIKLLVNKLDSWVLYYSLAGSQLFAWLVAPTGHICKFHASKINRTMDKDMVYSPRHTSPGDGVNEVDGVSAAPILEHLINRARDLTIGGTTGNALVSPRSSDGSVDSSDSSPDKVPDNYHEMIDGEITPMARRRFFSSSASADNSPRVPKKQASMSSLPRSGSASNLDELGDSMAMLSTQTSLSSIPQPLQDLNELLLKPLEDVLMSQPNTVSDSLSSRPTLYLILHGCLHLVPFSILRSKAKAPFLHRRFHLVTLPLLQAVRSDYGAKHGQVQHLSKSMSHPVINHSMSSTRSRQLMSDSDSDHPTVHRSVSHAPSNPSLSLIVSNPCIPSTFRQMYSWHNLPAADAEAATVAEVLGGDVLNGMAATKHRVLRQMPSAQLIHFSTHMSWKLGTLVMAPKQLLYSPHTRGSSSDGGESSGAESTATADERVPELSEFLVTPVDLLQLKLASVRLFVLGGCHSTGHGQVSPEGMVALCQSLLASGAACVLLPLWPVSPQAGKLFMAAFYNSLLSGSRASRALSYAMWKVQQSKRLWHPVNWAGYMLFGQDILLRNNSAELANALRTVMQMSVDCGQHAFQTLRHLVKGAVQRIEGCNRSSVKSVFSWSSIQRQLQQSPCNTESEMLQIEQLCMDILRHCGFYFQSNRQEPSSQVILLPEHDDPGLLRRCLTQLESFVGLGQDTLQAITKVSKVPAAVPSLAALLQQGVEILRKRTAMSGNASPPAPLTLPAWVWHVHGVNELTKSLSLLPSMVTDQQVVFSISVSVERRLIQGAAHIVSFTLAQDSTRTPQTSKQSRPRPLATSC